MSAVELVLLIEKAMGKRLPLVSFYQHPSARRLAAVIEQDTSADDLQQQEVITLSRVADHHAAQHAADIQSDRPPLFCLPGRGGTAFNFQSLARALNDEQTASHNQRTVIGLQYPGLSGVDQPFDDVPSLARELIRRIQLVRPVGPYLLLGYSFGGLVAYEIAHQLRQAGQAVDFVGLIDTTAPASMAKKPLFQRLALHVNRIVNPGELGRMGYIRTRAARIPAKLLGRSRNAPTPTLGDEIEPTAGPTSQIAVSAWSPSVPLDISLESTSGQTITQALQRLVEATTKARQKYTNPPALDGPIHLYKSESKPEWLEFCTLGDDYGWARLVRGQVIQNPIKGSHLKVLNAGNVPTLAKLLKETLTVTPHVPAT